MYRALLAALLWAMPAVAETLPGPYAAEILRVIDGDTFEARIRLWLNQDLVQKVRLAGIDAPELTGPCPEAGRAARARLAELLDGPV
ncbi:MAG: nuclease, partial [Magnetospirillum sp. WYHS-4]